MASKLPENPFPVTTYLGEKYRCMVSCKNSAITKCSVYLFSMQQHLMADLFLLPKHPFFRSTQLLKLEKLNPAAYCDFIVAMFHKYKEEIKPEIAKEIIEWVNNHTYYVQQLCNRVFAAVRKEVTSAAWKQQAYLILKEQESVFFAFRNLLTQPQWKLLKAIASEGMVYQPTSKEFMGKYNLGTSATVLRSLKTLQSYELVYNETDTEGLQYYCVYDVFFQRWCQNEKNLLSI